jgi:hypothetical protein
MITVSKDSVSRLLIRAHAREGVNDRHRADPPTSSEARVVISD